jgi:hypothetical protein
MRDVPLGIDASTRTAGALLSDDHRESTLRAPGGVRTNSRPSGARRVSKEEINCTVVLLADSVRENCGTTLAAESN